MKYLFGFRFTARYSTVVKADNVKAAQEIAEDNYIEADFGEAEDIDGRRVRTIDNGDGTYKVIFRFSARYKTAVENDVFKEAVEAAEEIYNEADFGEAEDIDGAIRFVEDENGNRIDYIGGWYESV